MISRLLNRKRTWLQFLQIFTINIRKWVFSSSNSGFSDINVFNVENSDLAQNSTEPQFSKYHRPGRRQVNLINCKPIKFLMKARKQNTKHVNLWILETIRYNTHLRKLNFQDLNHNKIVYYMHLSFWIKWNFYNLCHFDSHDVTAEPNDAHRWYK